MRDRETKRRTENARERCGVAFFDCKPRFPRSRRFLPSLLFELSIDPQGPKGELELNYPDLVEIKKVRN